MIAGLGVGHWEAKFERRPFATRSPGAHPVGTDSKSRKQKETEMLAGKLPLPRPKPSMHHMQMGAGWKKRLGGGGTGMHFVTVAAAETESGDRLADAVAEYSRKYKGQSWFKRWSNAVQAAKAQRWLDEWFGERKAPESEAPQVMEMPQKSGAGSEEDPHQQQYSNEDFYEAADGGSEESREETSGGRKKQKKGSEVQSTQCSCKGPDGQHRCEAEAAEDGHCELCLLGCVVGEVAESEEGYRACTCATVGCTGCICGCECNGCISKKRMHAAANRDLL